MNTHVLVLVCIHRITINTDSRNSMLQKNLINKKRYLFRNARMWFFFNIHELSHFRKINGSRITIQIELPTFFGKWMKRFAEKVVCAQPMCGNRFVKTNDFAEIDNYFFFSLDRMLIDSICSSFCGNDCDLRSGPESARVPLMVVI